MYKDIITYELADNITLEHLKSVAENVVNNWMKNQPGFIKWEINSNNDGSFTDIVSWNSREDAKASEKNMANIPNAAEWFGCYKEGTISSKNLSSIIVFE